MSTPGALPSLERSEVAKTLGELIAWEGGKYVGEDLETESMHFVVDFDSATGSRQHSSFG